MPKNWSALGIEGVPYVDTFTGPNGGPLALQTSYIEDEQGNSIRTSGLVELEQRQLDPSELEEMRKNKPPPLAPTPATVVPDDVVAIQNDGKRRVFAVSLRRDGVGQVVDLVNRDIALGLVTNQTDYAAARERALESRRVVLRQRQAAVVADVEALGGRVVASCSTLFCMTVDMTGAQVVALAKKNSNVERVDLDRPVRDDVGDAGASVAAGSQITAMIASGYDGQAYSRVRLAQVEGGGLKATHPGYKDTSSPGTRVGTLESCNLTTCTTVTSFGANEDVHATAVAGLLMGDLNDGQDSAITDLNDRYDKSGYSHEAYLAHAVAAPQYLAVENGFDYLAGQSDVNEARIINMSAGFDSDEPDPTCLGQDALSRKANDLFETGQLLFKSAGNTPGSPTNCTVGSPGSAIGVFTVGAHGVNGNYNPTVSEVRTEGIASYSSIGGNATEGGRRTIIDLTAFGCRKEMFDLSGTYTYQGCGTSISAPTVAAAAADFSDFYRYNNGVQPDPGTLTVNMLLMGDRKGQAGTKTYLFDNLWGGGRLRTRTFDQGGLDSPSQWISGSACLHNGNTYTVQLWSGVVMPATVDVVKAAIYWYDSRHENGTPIDDIDLDLYQTSSPAGYLLYSDGAWDEKEQVFYNSPGGRALELRIIGYNITSDNTGCGPDSQVVYYSAFLEDSARDDADGPANAGGGTGAGDVVPEF